MIVPGRHVEMELRDTSSMIVGGPIRFEIGLVDYDAGCRIDFEEYVIEDITLDPGAVLDAAVAHYRSLLLEHGVVENWPTRKAFRTARAHRLRPSACSQPTATSQTA
jgi:hypothetical protein